jgi:3-oxoacyl-[acyl-carrier-protein] synthase II
MQRRVVVTGMGMLSPLGNNVKDSWDGLVAGESGIRSIEIFDASQYRSQISGSVRNFNAELYMSSKDVRRTDLFIQYGVAAAEQAISDAGLEIGDEGHRIGVAIGAGIGGLPLLEKSHSLILESGPHKLSPFFIPAIIINMVNGHVSLKHGFKGPNISVVTACATGAHNIGLAARSIACHDADVMVCGGTEMATSAMGIGGFSAMHALSTRNDEPEKASRPWDKDRDGFVLGDGAGVLVLESLEHAKKRGAKIHAELAGFGMSADAYHITVPDPEATGGVLAMQNALQDAEISYTEIDYINAHGTSTILGDEIEALAIKKMFRDHANRLAVSSTKSMTGHLLGAAGAVEAIVSILAIRDQIAPPTINLDHPSKGCDLNFVPHQAQQRKIKAVLSNSFGFGGTNASLIFKKFE